MLDDHTRKAHTTPSSTPYTSRLEKDQQWKCSKPSCNNSYSTEKILKKDIKEMHADTESHINKAAKDDTKEFRCNRNNYNNVYTTKKVLNRHVKEKHSDVKK